MKKKYIWLLSLCAVCALSSIVACKGETAASSVGESSKESVSVGGGYTNSVDPLPMPVDPQVPELRFEDGVLSWMMIEGESYEVKIGDEDWEKVSECQIDLSDLSDLTMIQVRASRDGMVSAVALYMYNPM